MPPAGFETAIPVSERPQTHNLDRAATGIGGNGVSRSGIPVVYNWSSGHRLHRLQLLPDTLIEVRFVTTLREAKLTTSECLCLVLLPSTSFCYFPP
jgi:hypothetical protein